MPWVVWGSLLQLREATDRSIKTFAGRLQDRKLFKCIDIREMVQQKIDPENTGNLEKIEEIEKCCAKVLIKLQELKEQDTKRNGIPAILTDEDSRPPYKTGGGSHGPLERINVRTGGGDPIDLKQLSKVVAGLRDFNLTRAYFDRDRQDIGRKIKNIVKEELETCHK